jgi:hypothetical protein
MWDLQILPVTLGYLAVLPAATVVYSLPDLAGTCVLPDLMYIPQVRKTMGPSKGQGAMQCVQAGLQ